MEVMDTEVGEQIPLLWAVRKKQVGMTAGLQLLQRAVSLSMAVLISLHLLTSLVQQTSWRSRPDKEAGGEAWSNVTQFKQKPAAQNASRDAPLRHWAYKFSTLPGRSDYASCSGVYEPASGIDYELNGKLYYINREKDRFLSWTNNRWEITGLGYLSGIQRHHKQHGFYPGSFGGFHSGSIGGENPDVGTWRDYSVERVVPRGSDAEVHSARGDASPDIAFDFKLRAGVEDDANCSGLYVGVDGAENVLNGKPVYINEEKQRFLAFIDGMWEVASTHHLENLKKAATGHSGVFTSFSGYHWGGGRRAPDDGTWSNYIVRRIKRQHIGSARLYTFSPKLGSENYAGCDGSYRRATDEDNEINGKPYYVSEEKHRLLAWTGGEWEITSTDYLPAIQTHHAEHGFWPGSFGGFHAGGGDWPDDGSWQGYHVKSVS